MRNLTEKKYKQTFEVKKKQLDMKRKEEYRTNRLMAEVFKKVSILSYNSFLFI